MGIPNIQVGGWLGKPAPGFLARLILVDIRDVVRIDLPTTPLPNYTLKSNAILYKPGTLFHLIRFPSKECTLTEEQDETGDGMLYTPALSAKVPRNTPDLAAWIATHQGKRWLAMWKERSGLMGVAGEIGNGLALSVSRSITDQNTTLLSLAGQYTHPYYYIPKMPQIELPSGFSPGFSSGFGK
ncbi:hypothetical protein BWI93_10295 [Siphonobacter sp. BAB-5385]|uniref:hypothetical protein n=1 Tax=Siphonobacter sp. BAB-5385 TaxID=1864822 RepID=UPI000B9E99D0|nr:hypothetical protein [Siphonobacter sp. BAB-5385]OZI08248.1 hypothetical protein BWI93_10295 [Siphonobacter sp. BAB-5385]